MKVIDLLNKIANGEEAPKTIKYRGLVFDYDDIDYFNTDLGYLFEKYVILEILNDEVKIIEEKKIPEKLEDYSLDKKGKYPISPTLYEEILKDKINELIDYLKSKGDE